MANRIADGILEFERGTGNILYDWKPAEHLNYFLDIPGGGDWSAVFGADAQHWRMATGVEQDADGSYMITYTNTIIGNADGGGGFTTFGVAKINAFNNSEIFVISPQFPNMVVYPNAQYIEPRNFRVLENGNYFMMSNTMNGDSTRIHRYFLEFGYMGYYTMFWNIEQVFYRLLVI